MLCVAISKQWSCRDFLVTPCQNDSPLLESVKLEIDESGDVAHMLESVTQ